MTPEEFAAQSVAGMGSQVFGQPAAPPSADPATKAEAAAQQLGQIPADYQGEPVTEQQIAQQAVASAGLGATDIDPDLFARIVAGVRQQLQAEAQASAPGGHPLVNTVASLAGFLASHGDQAAIELGADLVEAAGHAIKSGSTEFVEKIQAKLVKHLARNPPAPGENYAYKQAVDFAGPHLDDAIGQATPPVTAVALPSAGGQPVKVLAGNVTG